MGEVRKPVKKSSIAKKNKIIEKGFELMCEKGYHNVNTIDIAKYSGVSTGIIYQYFKDKKDIFIEGAKLYLDKIMFPTKCLLGKNLISKKTLEEKITLIIDDSVKMHTLSQNAHKELMMMCTLDKSISNIFKEKENEFIEFIMKSLSKENIEISNLKEKAHIIFNLIDSLCHEISYHKGNYNYDIMKKEIVKVIVSMLGGCYEK